MPDKTNRLKRFWQEIKRRNVHRSLAVYAGSAFVILEASTIIFPRWGLPDWTIDLVLYLLIFGAIITIIVSWIFDVTAEGIEKTKPLREIRESDKPVVSAGWKAATIVSIVVIIGLVILNIVGSKKTLKAGDIQSLMILPFENFTGDEELDNMISSMHSLMIGDVGRIGSLRVISPSTSKVYKNIDKSISEIASELDVEAVLDLDVMCLGDTICFQAKMITAYPEEKVIWVADYREDKAQILNLYNRITKQVADEVMVELTPDEERLLAKSRIVDREVYDEFLRGYILTGDLRYESLCKARDYLNSAIEKDPDWAPLYSGLASVWLAIQNYGYESPAATSPKIYENLNKALELDPDLADSHSLSATIAQLMEWDWEKSEKEFLRALAINPNDAFSRIGYSHLLCILQRPDEALYQGQLALNLDPLNLKIKSLYAILLYSVGDCNAALDIAEEVVADDPVNSHARFTIENAAYCCNEYDKAFEAGIYNLAVSTLDVEEDSVRKIETIYEEQGFAAAYAEEVRMMVEFASNNSVSPGAIASTYMCANQPEKAMDWLEKGFEIHDPQMRWITSMYNFKPLYDNPRFIDIVEKMNLPLPYK